MQTQPPEPHSQNGKAIHSVIREWIAIAMSIISIGIVMNDRRDHDRERLTIVECVLHIDQRCKPKPDR